MGWFERLLIRGLEPVVDRRWRRNDTAIPTRERLSLGQARAAFGRNGTAPVSLTVEQRLRHTLKVGGTGSGKSVSELGDRLHDLSVGQPFLMLDCHDSIDKLLRLLARETAKGNMPESILKDVWFLSLADNAWTVKVNPLECARPEQAAVKIAPFMALLRVLWGEVMGPQTHEFTQNLLTLLAERKLPLTHVPTLLNDTTALRTHAMQLLNQRPREYFLGRFLSWSPRRRIQVADAFANKYSVLLADPRIAAMLDSPTSDIDFRQAMDTGKTILISISKGQFYDSASMLASMILVSLQQAAFSRADMPEAQRSPYFIVIEEFPSFAAGVTVEPFLSEARKFGIGLTLIAQTFASLDRTLLSSIRANCYTQMFFRLSPEDARIAAAGLSGEVRELVSRELVSLPIGTSMLMQGGGTPRRLTITHTPVPERLSHREREIIERLRTNIGQPLHPSGTHQPPQADSAIPAIAAVSPVLSVPQREPQNVQTGKSTIGQDEMPPDDFVEGDE